MKSLWPLLALVGAGLIFAVSRASSSPTNNNTTTERIESMLAHGVALAEQAGVTFPPARIALERQRLNQAAALSGGLIPDDFYECFMAATTAEEANSQCAEFFPSEWQR